MTNTYPTMTKRDIANFARKIASVLKKHHLLGDVSLFYNNRKVSYRENFDFRAPLGKEYSYTKTIMENTTPFDYFDYANERHILSLATEGVLYDRLYNGYGFPEELEKLFKDLHLYYEQGNSWNLTFYPTDEEQYKYIAYTDYEEKVPKSNPIRIWYGCDHAQYNPVNVPLPLKKIMQIWYDASKGVGDKGSCVLGAGFEFDFDNNHYIMSACSPYQGSLSWETHKDTINLLLTNAGATNVVYKWGNID